jgi:hypothetical protein
MLFKKKKSKNFSQKKVKKLLDPFINESCIYFNNPKVCVARLEDFTIDKTGLQLNLHCDILKGLNNLPENMVLDSMWEDLHVTTRQVICYDKGWHLFFDEGLIMDIKNIANQEALEEARLLQIMDRILNFMSRES